MPENRYKYLFCNVWWTWFSFTFRYVDDVFSLINSKFGDNVDRILSLNIVKPSLIIYNYSLREKLISIVIKLRSSYFSSLMQYEILIGTINSGKYFLCNVWWTWFSFTFRYVDDVFLLINSKFGDNVDRILSNLLLGIKLDIVVQRVELPKVLMILHEESDINI
jgi:uncharacterized membrane protein